MRQKVLQLVDWTDVTRVVGTVDKMVGVRVEPMVVPRVVGKVGKMVDWKV